MPPKSTCPSPSERKRPARFTQGWKPRIDALPAGRVELGVLHVEGADALVIDVDEVEIVELLQHEMRGIVVDAAALVAVDALEEHLEGDAVEDVLAGMQLEADIDALLVEGVEDRLPALGQFVEGCLDQARRALRPGIEKGQAKAPEKVTMRVEAEIARGLGAPSSPARPPISAAPSDCRAPPAARRRRRPAS